ncbi:hypothetical protein VT84_12910 [Gemmata sp. SH-PL17]|uniref:hypothetical protein n=1 Tax=Gemmata sp. SH-PL17 TaxID=1630693 RepID=UPI00078D8117|nr:hypothetical protein [Gemmata sp. SH-PL17]AMV25293.1 hypothetical protein VT84_12910 [Gemmata sp. SH-PL17]
MPVARYFKVWAGALPEELGRYPADIAARLLTATDVQKYRFVQTISLQVATDYSSFVASDTQLQPLFARLEAVDPVSAPFFDLAGEADRLCREAEARATDATPRVGVPSDDEYMDARLRRYLAELVSATQVAPGAAALASTLVALQNLYMKIEEEFDFRRLLRLRDRVIDNTGTVRPWPCYAGLASRLGPRMTAPLEHASDGALRRLALAYARVAAGTLPRPLPTPLRKLLGACRRYSADTADDALRVRVHHFASRYSGALSDRVEARSHYLRKKWLNPDANDDFLRIKQLGLVSYVFEVASSEDVFDALDWTTQHVSDTLEQPLLSRVQRRCERILRRAMNPEGH